ncbi:MAG: 50S ribosomal protein L24 [Mycoplasmataceae bacterium]|jgi:large subunit ribosomal protein L24|nr:50S ribosomal protein L24 [Mycoplasmataceae bacterium]
MNRIIRGDRVRVIAGKEKAKTGIVINVYPKKQTAIVEGINIMKRHVKPGKGNNDKGGISSKEYPISLAKLAIIDEKGKNGISKVKFVIKDAQKVRIAKRSNTTLTGSTKK